MKKNIMSCFLVFILVFSLFISAAAHLESFDIDQYIENHPEDEWKRYHFREREKMLHPNFPIVTYDVSKDGKVLLGLLNNTILLLDEQQNSIKTFSFSTDGAYYVRWEGEHILICFQRENLIAELTETGELLHLIKVDLSTPKNNAAVIQLQRNPNVTVNGTTYSIKNKILPLGLFGCYAKLTKTNVDGTRTVLYNALPFLLTVTILGLTFVLLALFFFFYNIFKQNPKFIERKRKIMSNSPLQKITLSIPNTAKREKVIKIFSCLYKTFSLFANVIFIILLVHLLFAPPILFDFFEKIFPHYGIYLLPILFIVFAMISAIAFWIQQHLKKEKTSN